MLAIYLSKSDAKSPTEFLLGQELDTLIAYTHELNERIVALVVKVFVEPKVHIVMILLCKLLDVVVCFEGGHSLKSSTLGNELKH